MSSLTKKCSQAVVYAQVNTRRDQQDRDVGQIHSKEITDTINAGCTFPEKLIYEKKKI